MRMFQQIGEFTPDSLIASQEFPILKEGIGLKAGQGLLRRGSLIIKAEGAGYIAGAAQTAESGETEKTEAAAGKVFGILADDADTGGDASASNIPAVVYLTGVFDRDAVLVSGEGAAAGDYEDEMKGVGLYLRSVQHYG